MITLFGRQFLCTLALGLNPQSCVDDCLRSDDIDWMSMLSVADKQAMIGIFNGGIMRLAKEVNISTSSLLQIHSSSTFVVDRNREINTLVEQLFTRFKDEGIEVFLLKGQGVGHFYPEPDYRQSGDIDIFAPDQFEKIDKLLQSLPHAVNSGQTIKHHSFDLNGIEIENHIVIAEFYSFRYQRTWNRILSDLLRTSPDGYGDVRLFNPQLNILYVFIHFLHHLMREGVGLRQLCDWLMLWKSRYQQIDSTLFLRHAEELGLTRAMTAAFCIGYNYLGFVFERIPMDIATPQALQDADLMLKDILIQGNFGHESGLYRLGTVQEKISTYYKRLGRLWHFRRFHPFEVISFPFSRLNYWLNNGRFRE